MSFFFPFVFRDKKWMKRRQKEELGNMAKMGEKEREEKMDVAKKLKTKLSNSKRRNEWWKDGKTDDKKNNKIKNRTVGQA